MDVRCEKCQTEYELDESRLKPGGVTVKCTVRVKIPVPLARSHPIRRAMKRGASRCHSAQD
jgi:predicted Zn finger-like uncharacterized protein